MSHVIRTQSRAYWLGWATGILGFSLGLILGWKLYGG
jgi:hypothetical protein